MRRPTLNHVTYVLKVLTYLLLYIGVLHRKSHRPPTTCRFMMLYYLWCNIWIIRPSFCSPSGRVSSRCPQSTGGEIWLELQEHPSHDCCCPFDSQSSEHHTVLCQDSPVWWHPQSEIPEWLPKKGPIVWPKVGVCGQEYSQEDWQITET